MVAAGDPIYASDINDYRPRWFVKPLPTNLTVNTALGDDPHLKGIALGVGTWEIELVAYFTLTTTATQKIKTRWAHTGTWNGTSAVRNCVGPGAANTSAPSGSTEVMVQGYQVSGQDAVYDVTAGIGYACFREIATVTVTVTGTMSLQWAQVASSANATNMQEGTYFRITKIS